jgi:Methyltransferase FkbM domain
VFNGERYDRPFPRWWTEISSLDKYHLERELPAEVHSCIGSIKVPTLTLRQIVDEVNDNVNLIVMDVEGHETLILQDLLRSDIRPNVIVFEHKHMPSADLKDIKNEFSAQGYIDKSYGRDTILSRMQVVDSAI